MCSVVWTCVVALVVIAWGYPSSHQTICDEFSGDTQTDPRAVIGNWTTVYAWRESAPDINACSNSTLNIADTLFISETTEEQCQQHNHILKGYKESEIRFKLLVQDVSARDNFMYTFFLIFPKNNLGNLDAFTVEIGKNNDEGVLPSYQYLPTRWKKVDNFLLLMLCSEKLAFVLASSSIPDEDKLQDVVANIHFKGYIGCRVSSNM